MNFGESLGEGLRTLRVNRLRSTLALLGIIIGVAAVICMVAVASGARLEVSEKIRTLGANLLLIRPGAQSSGGVRREAGTRHTLTEDDASAIRRQFHDVQIAAPLLSHSMQVVAGNRNWATLVAGINPDYLVAREWRIANGRSLTAEDLEAGAKVAIIGAVIAAELFDGQPAIGQMLRIGNVPFTVIAVLDKKGLGVAGRSQDDVVFVPLATTKGRLFGAVHGGTHQALDLIVVKAVDATAVPHLQGEIKALLRERHQLRGDRPDDFSIENPADVMSARAGTVRILGYLLISIASLSLIVGGISIMNTMLVSVTERTREIGLRMAVGARRRDIRRQFLAEAATLALVGGVCGVAVGCLAATLVAWQAGWPVLLSPSAIALACGFAGLVGVFFGLYPAYRASRLDPIAALRAE